MNETTQIQKEQSENFKIPNFKGEGGANTVLQYHSPDDFSQVIRIRKSCENESSEKVKSLEKETWPDLFHELPDEPSILQLNAQYITKVMAPLIGCQYLAPQKLVSLTHEESQLYLGATEGVVMPDVTLLPPPSSVSRPSLTTEQFTVVCIEIKPKFGYITSCATVRPQDVPLKHTTSRYRLHQQLKLEQGKIEAASAYDPVDLFSGEAERVQKALFAILDHPQNNLTLFINGQRWREDETKKVESEPCLCKVAAEALFPAAHLISAAENDEEIEENGYKMELARLLRCIFQQETSLLENILAAQCACLYDIEGVYRLYCHLLGIAENLENATDGKEEQEDADDSSSLQREFLHHRQALDTLLSLPRDEALAVLRSYVISTTSKDCSIMITLRRCEEENEEEKVLLENKRQEHDSSPLWSDVNRCGVLLLHHHSDASAGAGVKYRYRYRIAVVDLDKKSLEKIPKHHLLDRDIISTGVEQMQTKNELD